MSNSHLVRGLSICLIFLPAVAAAESGPAPAAAGVARAARAGCAKLVCQRRAPSADRGASAESPAAEANDSGFAVLLGLGAGAFLGPKPEGSFPLAEPLIQQYDPAPAGQARIDGATDTITYEPSNPRRAKVEGPAVSLGVSLNQPLFAAAALHLGLEERFLLTALLSLSGGSSGLAGFGDILLSTRQASWPLQVAVGPSLAVVKLDVPSDDTGIFEEAGVIAGGAALLRLDLAQAVPGTLDLVGHYGKAMTYESGSSYRDLQLAFALRL